MAVGEGRRRGGTWAISVVVRVAVGKSSRDLGRVEIAGVGTGGSGPAMGRGGPRRGRDAGRGGLQRVVEGTHG